MAVVFVAALLLLGLGVRLGGERVWRALTPLSGFVSGRTVIIDPGHGGPDPGCVSASGLCEKEIVLDVAHRLETYFRRAAVYTVLTRRDDRDLADEAGEVEGGRKVRDLEGRIALARRSQGDLLLSIHANAFPSPVWSGAQTFYYPGREDSKQLAVLVQNVLVDRLGPNTRKAKAGEFRLLEKVPMPAIIIEIGFLSNPREAELLARPEYRERIAEAIFTGVVQYWLRRGQGGEPAVDGLAGVEPPPAAPLPQWRLKQGEALLYFGGPTNLDDFLAPEIRAVPALAQEKSLEKRIQAIVEELLAGPGEGSILAPTLPRRARLRKVWVRGEIVQLDFDRALVESFHGGARSEELAVYSLVNTVTELVPGCRVLITVEGKAGATLAGHIVLDRPLCRNEEVLR